jgi:uracil-DNA glycosylase
MTMSDGFFDEEPAESKVRIPLLPACGTCGLYRDCRSPKMKPFGEGKRKVLILAEAPGQTEDEKGRPLIGKAGQFFREVVGNFGIDLDRDCWATNTLICRPPNNEIKNQRMIDFCRPNLVKTVNELRPETIVVLGSVAVKSLITGWLWPDTGGSWDMSSEEKNLRGKWCGWRIPCQEINSWIAPTWHPSYVMRVKNDRERGAELIDLWFRKDLEAAFALRGRPWKVVPDFAAKVEVILDDGEATEAVEGIAASGRMVAFDYECESLKPERIDNAIWSCALSNGQRTVSFPWAGKAVKAVEAFLRSGVPKAGANVSYETWWSLTKLGINVKGWTWDVVNSGHVIDNRAGVSGLDFQAWVLLGQPAWDAYSKKFLRSKGGGGNDRNKVREADLRKILHYGGLDALLTWKVAKKQMQILGKESP